MHFPTDAEVRDAAFEFGSVRTVSCDRQVDIPGARD
jgi:hypothetical protein